MKESESGVHKGYADVMKYLGMFGGTQFISTLLGLVRSKLSAQLLGAAGMGIIANFNRTIQLFSDSTNLALSFSAVRTLSVAYENSDIDTLKDSLRVVRSIAFYTGILGAFLLLVLSPLVSIMMFKTVEYYALHFAMLSPVVFFMALSGGEIAILRATRHYTQVALYSLIGAVVSLALSAPFYYFMGIDGIFPTIFLIALTQLLVLFRFSLPSYGYRILPFSFSLLKKGYDIVRLGAGYMYASIVTAASIWLVCNFLTSIGSEAVTGMFSVGFMFITTLPAVLFSALDSQYYPRLSSVMSDVGVRNSIVNEQVEVQLLVQAPAIIAFVVVLPILIPLLSTVEFMPVVAMTQFAMLGMLVRAMTYPISFLPLSKGDSLVFVIQESLYNLSFVVAIVLGYLQLGVSGIGCAISVVHIIDFIVVYSIARRRYSYSLSASAMRYFILQFPLLLLTIISCRCMGNGKLYWITGALFFSASILISLYVLTTRTKLLGMVMKRFKRNKK